MVLYHCEDIAFHFKGKRFNNRWLTQVAARENCRLGDIAIVFCSDGHILKINEEYLHHHYFTDIITFDYRSGDKLSGDLFVSVDTVRRNAELYRTSFDEELNRVMVHGILHLAGYGDGTEKERKVMRDKEDEYLLLRKEMQ